MSVELPDGIDPYEGLEPFDDRMLTELSVARAVIAGHALVSGGVLAIVALTMVLGSFATNLPLVGLAGIGCLLGWPYWSAMIPRWWRWALVRGVDPYDLQKAAEAAQLVWPRDSVLAKTEFGNRWEGIDTPLGNPFSALRDQLLSGADAVMFGVSADEPLWGIVSEFGLASGTATLIALDDGTCSLYTSTSGGVIGAGEHEAVRGAAGTLIDVAGRVAGTLKPLTDRSMPGQDEICFFLLLSDRVLGVRGARETLLARDPNAAELYAASMNLLMAVREQGNEPGTGVVG